MKWIGAVAVVCIASLMVPAVRAADFVLVAEGVAPAPIVVAAQAPVETVRAATTLADYVEKIAGARPVVLTGVPEPVPDRAIWVGVQPPLSGLFPGMNFEFQHPEEILIVCNGRHLAIAGRDRVFGNVQTEYGSANAVYTFLQKYLDVRWLWPGPLGEDLVERKTLAWALFEHRFHPPFLMRGVFLRPAGATLDWARRQRIALDSLQMDIGHAFGDWWEKYHREHPDYFALQPDGTRSGFPSPDNAKLCEANSNVWAQWWSNAADAIRKDPTATVLSAAPNDGSNAGICICEACRAWDHPDGRPWKMSWNGLTEEYVAMTDRYVTFWNILARGLKARFPGRELYVSGMAYGPAKPPPLKAKLEDNLVIGYVGHFPLAGEAVREAEKEEWRQWSTMAPKLMFRPNLFWYSGGFHALPTLVTRHTMEDFRFLAAHSGIGLAIDTTPQHWATQGPQYYVMAQFAWDPMQDGSGLMEDYYRRGFGPAAEPVRRYFDLMEEAHVAILNTPGWRHSMGAIKNPLTGMLVEQYNAGRLAQAETLMKQAEAQTVSGPAKYRERVAFVRTGLDYTRLFMESLEAMTAVRESRGKDAEAVRKALAVCEARDALFKRHDGLALNAHLFKETWVKSREMEDYVGPPSDAFLKAAGLKKIYRWTGRKGDSLWTSAGNWEAQDGDTWAPSGDSPGGKAVVRLGDATPEDKPQRILLNRDIAIERLVMEAGGRRAYTIASREDRAEDMLDSDSGMLYGLRLTDGAPLEQATNAAQALSLQVETRFTFDGKAVVRLWSTNGAAVIMERALKAEKGLAVQGGDGGDGVLEWRQRVASPSVELAGGARLFLNLAGDFAFGNVRGVQGLVLVRRSTVLAKGMNQFGGTVAFRAQGAGTNDVVVAVGDLTRGGKVMLLTPTDGSRGRLVLAVDTIDSRAGRTHAPALHAEAGTFVDLGGDQPGPMRADLAAGIHGAGGLIKAKRAGGRGGSKPISIIGERNTYTGGTLIESGTLRLERVMIPADGTVGGSPDVDYAGCLGPGLLRIAAGGVFDLNGLTQTVSGLEGEGTILLNGGTLILTGGPAAVFKGAIKGPGKLIEGERERVLGEAD